MTMPGVGPIVALTVKSAIDDPERFRSSKDVGPWVGLTPRREQSGERDIMGSISRAGDAGLRTGLYQAAIVMLHKGRPNWLTAWAWNVAKRCGKKRATVALACDFWSCVCVMKIWFCATNNTSCGFCEWLDFSLQALTVICVGLVGGSIGRDE